MREPCSPIPPQPRRAAAGSPHGMIADGAPVLRPRGGAVRGERGVARAPAILRQAALRVRQLALQARRALAQPRAVRRQLVLPRLVRLRTARRTFTAPSASSVRHGRS
jgi:hypothetical protein